MIASLHSEYEKKKADPVSAGGRNGDYDLINIVLFHVVRNGLPAAHNGNATQIFPVASRIIVNGAGHVDAQITAAFYFL